jgi:hypothetical protein
MNLLNRETLNSKGNRKQSRELDKKTDLAQSYNSEKPKPLRKMLNVVCKSIFYLHFQYDRESDPGNQDDELQNEGEIPKQNTMLHG